MAPARIAPPSIQRNNMYQRLVFGFILIAGLVAGSTPADAQTRISLDAGALLPVGDMDKVNDLSPYVGARWEYQETNALDRVSTRTWFLRFGYGLMVTDDALELADDSDGHFWDLCIGGRAYASSRFSPFFMSLSGGYAQYSPPGPSDNYHGGTFNGGLGVRLPFLGFVFEAEARGHLTFLDGTDNIQFFTGNVSLGIPL
jgi:hypothetical protein